MWSLICLLVSLFGGLVAIGSNQEWIRNKVPYVKTPHFDRLRNWIVVILFIVGFIGLIDRFQKEKAKDEKITDLGLEFSNEKWGKASKLDPFCGTTGGAMCFGKNSICMVLNSTLSSDSGSVSPICEETNYEKWLQAIEAEPTCPFPHFYLAWCYKSIDVNVGRDHAIKAKVILEKTTQFPGHNSAQDQVLHSVNALLKNELKYVATINP